MRIFLIVILLGFSASPCLAQIALFYKPPSAFGPVKSITDQGRSVTFSRDKTRIDERFSNGRTVVWLFTAQGKLLTSEMFERNGRPSGDKSVYDYDSTGQLISITKFRSGSLSSTETVTYPAARTTKITRVFEPNHDSAIETDEYDENGNISKATIQERRGSTVEIYKYDDKGNPTDFVATTGNKVLVKETYRYEYDSFGNWTTKKVATSPNPSLTMGLNGTIKRKIVYY